MSTQHQLQLGGTRRRQGRPYARHAKLVSDFFSTNFSFNFSYIIIATTGASGTVSMLVPLRLAGPKRYISAQMMVR